MFQSRRAFFLSSVAAGLCAARASAQIEAYTFQGTTSGNQLGLSVRNAFDVDNDGYDDVIVGEPFANPNGPNSGRARVYSGKTGAVLYTFEGLHAGDQFGTSVCGIGDINFDGRSDLAVGAPMEDLPFQHAGAVYFFSGAGGTQLQRLSGNQAGEEFGYSIASAGDLDADGRPDLIIGMPYWDYGGPQAGGFTLVDGHLLVPFTTAGVWHGTEPGALLGWSVAGGGNVNHDGHEEVIVGSPHSGANNEGRVDVVSWWTGSLLDQKFGNVAGGQLGYSVTGGRDFDGDGFADYAAGAPFDDTNGTNAGRVRAFSTHTGNSLFSIVGSSGNRFGYSVSAISDTNGDGDDDLLVGVPYADSSSATNAGVVRLLSGANGNVLESLWGDSASDHLGWSVSRGGDVNNDGMPDVIGGAPDAAPNGSGSGLAHVWFLGCPAPNTYCTAKVNSSGCTPQIGYTGVPTRITGADDFEINAKHVLKDKNGILFWGLASANAPFYGGTLCVSPPTVRTPVQNSGCPSCNACQGTYTFAFSHSYMATYGLSAGDKIYAQFWSRDPGFLPPNSIGLTDALRFTLCK